MRRWTPVSTTADEAARPVSADAEQSSRPPFVETSMPPEDDGNTADGALARQRWDTLQALLGCQDDPAPVADAAE